MSFRQLLAFVAVLAIAGAAFAQTPPRKNPQRAIKTTAEVSVGSRNATQSSIKVPMQATPVSPAAPASTPTPATASSTVTAARLAAMEAVQVKPSDATAGQSKAAACGACHGMDGNSTDAQYPKLAGQNEQYIARQLMNFKTGSRANAIMSGMASTLAPQDMHDIGAYFATQHSLPGVADATLAVAGGKLFREGDPSRDIPACMACHGPDGHGNPGAVYPQLAGQHADYIQKTLQAWHDGGSWGSDPHAQIMPAIAKRLSEADIAAVSSYVEGLHTAEPGEVVEGPEAPPPSASSASAPATLSSAIATPVAASSASPPAPTSTAAKPAPASSRH